MGDVFHGEFKVPQTLDSQYGNTIDGVSHFKLTLPSLIEVLQKSGIRQIFNTPLKKRQ